MFQKGSTEIKQYNMSITLVNQSSHLIVFCFNFSIPNKKNKIRDLVTIRHIFLALSMSSFVILIEL